MARLIRDRHHRPVTRGRSALGYAYELLASGGNSVIEPFIARFPRGRKSSGSFARVGYESNFALQKQIELRHGDKTYML